MTVEVNIVTDFAAVNDGVTSCAAAFNAFKAYGRTVGTEPIILTIPPGSYLITPTSGFNSWIADGVHNVTVMGYGATITNVNFGSVIALYDDQAKAARFQTAFAGQTSLTLVDVAQVSRFSVNGYVYIGGLDLQGFGSPVNHQYFEFNRITAIDAVTGVITLADPLEYTYLSTWPVYNDGDNFHPDCGGPGTIYVLHPYWDCYNYVYGLTIDSGGMCYFKGQECLFEDCYFGGPGNAPTMTRIHTMRNCVTEGYTEVDKGVDLFEAYDCQWNSIVKVQSASVKQMLLQDCTVPTQIGGTTQTTTLRRVQTAKLFIGPLAYGHGNSLTLEDCVINDIAYSSRAGAVADYTVANGVVSQPIPGHSPMVWAQPEVRMIHGVPNENAGRIFRVLGVRHDGTNATVMVDTTLPEPLVRPPSQVGTAPTAAFTQYQGLGITATGCTGCPEIIDLCNKGSRPALAYAQRMLTGNFGIDGAVGPVIDVYGKLETIRINVTQPYTGVRSSLFLRANQFNNLTPIVLATNTKSGSWGYSINLKIAGERIITPSGNSGMQSGDLVTAIPDGGLWFYQNSFRPHQTGSIAAESSSTWPIITITWEMDHLIPAELLAGSGSYVLAGTDAVLTQSATAKIIAGGPGNYLLEGADQALGHGVNNAPLVVAAGSYALIGSSIVSPEIGAAGRDMKISQLVSAATLDGTEAVPVVQNGVTVKVSVASLRDLSVYAVATAPNATIEGAGTMIYVSDGNAGVGCMAVSDGLNWKVVALGAAISGS